MNYHHLMDLAINIGYELAISGAETFRIEDTITHILDSYGIASEVFAIPNFLIVTISEENQESITRMRRIGYHGTDLDMVENLNGLSRAICNRHPSPEEALQWLKIVHEKKKTYTYAVTLLGHFLGAMGFSILFGCGFIDMFYAGLCGIVIGLVNRNMQSLRVNPFFSTIAASFFMALAAYGLNVAGLVKNPDAVNIGALMNLVPGLLFTNAMRDIIYGDTNSGVNRIVQVFLIAAAIALGTAAALNFVNYFFTAPPTAPLIHHPLIVQCFAAFIGCIGFSLQFNIHGPGGLLCALGGALAWGIYSIIFMLGFSELLAYFFAAAFAAVYAESMARIRKYPAISYLVVSIFPFIPGAGIYYAMTYAVDGQMQNFISRGMYTAAISGVIAVGILLVSTSVKMIHTWRSLH